MRFLRFLEALMPPYRRDAAYRQALEDQKKASYPGCREGAMDCVALCGCWSESTPQRCFVTARAAKLRRDDGSADENPSWGNLQMPIRLRDEKND